MLLGLARVQTGKKARDNRTTKKEYGDEKPASSESRQEELRLSDMSTWWEGQWAYTSKEEELSTVVAQGQKGMRVDLCKVRLITGEGLPNITKD